MAASSSIWPAAPEMRFLGLVVVLTGATVAYFLGYRGFTVDQMRTRLAQLLNLPGLAPSPSSGVAGFAQANTLNPIGPGVVNPSAGLQSVLAGAQNVAAHA